MKQNCDRLISVHPCDKTTKGGCEHVCEKDGDEPVCKCNKDYKLNELNKKTCSKSKLFITTKWWIIS